MENHGVAFLLIAFLFLISSCSILQQTLSNRFDDGYYRHHKPGERSIRVYVNVEEDSIALYRDGKITTLGKKDFFYKPSFDMDILTIPFKYRPSSLNSPRQLDTDFNGNIYFGYRRDRFRIKRIATPAGVKRQIIHKALTLGGFGGFGSSFISPWTTNYRTADEYSGFILSRGISMMASLNSLTVGFGVGWDTLTDRDKYIWIYHNKPWYGVTIGIGIN